MNIMLSLGHILVRALAGDFLTRGPGCARLRADGLWNSLDSRQSVRTVRARGQRIECQSGTVWLTEEGNPRDIILGPGQSYAVESNGHVLIHAFEASRIRCVPAGLSPLPRGEGPCAPAGIGATAAA